MKMAIEYGVTSYDDEGAFHHYANRNYQEALLHYRAEVRRHNCNTGIVVEFSVGQWSTKNWKYGQYEYRPLFRFEAPDYRAQWRHEDY